MKRFLIILMAALIALPAFADVDLSGLTFEELARLRDRCQMEMMARGEWQEVTVPAGVWQIGVDIPAGHWTIRPVPNSYTSVVYCDRLNKFGTGAGIGWLGWNGTLNAYDNESMAGERREVDLDMVEGMYFLNRGTVIFTPYTGKPDLGFK